MFKILKIFFFNLDNNNFNTSLNLRLNIFFNIKKLREDVFGIFFTIPTSSTSFFVFFYLINVKFPINCLISSVLGVLNLNFQV
jgi:hypothetical protein